MVAQEPGLLDRIKGGLESFNKPTNWYIEIAGYLIAGFIVGFLIKHAGRLFFWLILGAALSLWALEFLHVISIDYSMLKSLIGLSSNVSANDLFSSFITWIRHHIVESLAGLFGFILAWKFA